MFLSIQCFSDGTKGAQSQFAQADLFQQKKDKFDLPIIQVKRSKALRMKGVKSYGTFETVQNVGNYLERVNCEIM